MGVICPRPLDRYADLEAPVPGCPSPGHTPAVTGVERDPLAPKRRDKLPRETEMLRVADDLRRSEGQAKGEHADRCRRGLTRCARSRDPSREGAWFVDVLHRGPLRHGTVAEVPLVRGSVARSGQD